MRKRRLQIGVIGSTADLAYKKELAQIAYSVGYLIAKSRAILVFGAEKDFDSLPSVACRGAKKAGGICVGVTYGKGKNIVENSADIVVATGVDRGGGREFPLILSCDAVIALAGGSGTLTEIAIAYQANIPVIVIDGTGGWSAELAGRYLDARRRICVKSAKDPRKAVMLAIKSTKL